MNLLLFAAKNGSEQNRLHNNLTGILSTNELHEVNSMDGLVKLFHTPGPRFDLIILIASDSQELAQFSLLENELLNTRFILILPERSKKIIAEGHALMPRFISYMDSDFCSEIMAIVKNIQKREIVGSTRNNVVEQVRLR